MQYYKMSIGQDSTVGSALRGNKTFKNCNSNYS